MKALYHVFVILTILVLTVLIGEDIYSHLSHILSKGIAYVIGLILAVILETAKSVLMGAKE